MINYQKYTVKGLLAYCRNGFEKECLQEIEDRAGNQLVYGFARVEQNSGYLYWECTQGDLAAFYAGVNADSCIFIRQLYLVTDRIDITDPKDRVSPILASLGEGASYRYLHVESPAQEDDKGSLQKLCKKLTPPLSAAMKKANLLTSGGRRSRPDCFVVFLNGETVLTALGAEPNISAYPLGIPRLRFSSEAPSRSALKIEEAFMVMVSPEERSFILKRGQKGVDLGAAPGGWTWFMVEQGLKMTAVDHGSLAPSLLEDPAVSHVSADGFVYKPPRQMDWVVCDIVDKPRRTLDRMTDWLVHGWSSNALFNLKLPMKSRYDMVWDCLQNLQRSLEKASIDHEIRCRQLYHDREEVTILVVTGEMLPEFRTLA